MKARQSLRPRPLPPMTLLRNKLLLPKAGEPRQEGKPGPLKVEVEVEVEVMILNGLLEVVTPNGLLRVVIITGLLKVVIVPGPPLTPLPLRVQKNLLIRSGLIVVPETAKRKSQTIR